MSIEDLTCLIVILLVVVFILRLISEKQSDTKVVEKEPTIIDSYAGSGPAHSEDKDEVSLPVIRDSKNEGREYLEIMTGELIGVGAQKAHANYNAKRRAAGDHTLQLWGINDSKRGYSTNYVGMRPPRRIPIDPTSAIQNGTSDMSDYTDPQTQRFI